MLVEMGVVADLSLMLAVVSVTLGQLPAAVHGQDPVVNLTSIDGLIQGVQEDIDGTTVDMYLGVPYAQPPVGDLRWAPPRGVQPWNYTYNATQYSPACPQPEEFKVQDLSYSEDCLYLNIFTPQVSEAALPVLVYIHGGAWSHGHAQQYDGRNLAAKHNIVVVTINYRLGILGFLTSESDAAQGNYGLLDQVQALQWIQDNIEDFLGDPGNVTLAGDEAGAVAATYHMLSPLSQGLFQRAIVMGDTSQYGSTPAKEPKKFDLKDLLAAASNITWNCADEIETESMLNCLKDIDEENITKLWVENTEDIDLSTWVGRKDGSFLPDYPTSLWTKQTAIPVIIGMVEPASVAGDPVPDLSPSEYRSKVSNMISAGNSQEVAPFITDAVMYVYRDWSNPDDPVDLGKQFEAVQRDMRLLGPEKAIQKYVQAAAEDAQNLNDTVNIYRYINSYQFENDISEGMMQDSTARLLFGEPVADSPFQEAAWSDRDKTVSQSISLPLASFIKTGDTTYDSSPILWPPYTLSKQEYLQISDPLESGSFYKRRQMAFWNTYRDQIIDNVEGLKASSEPEGEPEAESEPEAYFIATWVLVGVIVILFIIIIAVLCSAHKSKGSSYDLNSTPSVKYVAR